MPRIAALLRRHKTLLFLVCICLLTAATAIQTLRLRYLEERHAQMFRDFGKAQLDVQFKAGEIAQQLRACQGRSPSPAASSTRR